MTPAPGPRARRTAIAAVCWLTVVIASAGTAGTAGSTWWSFQPPVKPPVPTVDDPAWGRHPIDAFVHDARRRRGLTAVDRADRRSLIRRASFDLHGLPPTPEDVEAFVADGRANAYERLIDRLLASPRYGERWGRHWLDVVRYADTGGYDADVYFPNAWRYRDYVIQAFNDDEPYDAFVQQQIAGDELWPDSLDLEGSYAIPPARLVSLRRRLGTGLFTIGPVSPDDALDGRRLRAAWQTDAVDTMGAAFLGITVGCARCHNHKFDPISQREYYSLAAIFAGSEPKTIPAVSAVQVFDHAAKALAVRRLDDLRTEAGRVDDLVRARLIAERVRAAQPEVRKAYEIAPDARTPRDERIAAPLVAAIAAITPADLERHYTPSESERRAALIKAIGEAYLQTAAAYPTATVLGRSESVPETRILVRGDSRTEGELVQPGLPAAITGGYKVQPTTGDGPILGRRAALAQWLTRPDNPLVARVFVNRVWQHHFGRGLVATSNDFGSEGDAPTHPELLDWLATDFIEAGWRVKRLHRQIMLSETYQLSSRTGAAAKADPMNTFLWRANRRRLDAEPLRDAVLAVSGSLNLKMGGPGVVLPLAPEEREGLRHPEAWPVTTDAREHGRRSVYLLVKRSFPLPFLQLFDVPDTSTSCARRDTTVVPTQALALLNSPFMQAQAAAFAARLRGEHGDQPAAWVEAGWALVAGRKPTVDEKTGALAFLAASADANAGLVDLCLVWLNLSEFVYVD